MRRLPGIAWTRRLGEDHEDHQQQPSPGTEHPFVLPGVGARRASATCGHSSRHCPREQSVGHEDLRLWGVWPPGPVADSGRRVLVVPARSPSRRGITAAVVVAVSAALVQQACVPASCAARVVYPVAPPLSSRLTTVIGAGGSGGSSNVEGQLVGRLQAVRAEPHDFLPGLATAPAMMLRIGQTTTCLPVVGRPRRRHLMLALQATQRNPESPVVAMGDGPVADGRRTGRRLGIEGLLAPSRGVRWIEQEPSYSAYPTQPCLGETSPPIAAQEADMGKSHLQRVAELGKSSASLEGVNATPGVRDVRRGAAPRLLSKA